MKKQRVIMVKKGVSAAKVAASAGCCSKGPSES